MYVKIDDEMHDVMTHAKQGEYFEKDGANDLFRKNEQGLYVSFRNGTTHSSLEEYKDINGEIIDTLNSLEA